MNTFFFFACLIALLAVVPVPALQAVLATAASTLFESTPFILAGVVLAEVAPRRLRGLTSFIGCGCSGGPGALSIPVAAATALTFGPLVAAARWLAALVVSRILLRSAACPAKGTSAGSELATLLPFAIAAGAVFALVPWSSFTRQPLASAILAAIVAATASPCGFGAIALAATTHRFAPLAGGAILCIAGICDLRSLGAWRHRVAGHDAFAYLLAAAACALVAAHRGNALVNPRFSIPLFCCAVTFTALMVRHRRERAPSLRFAPVLMVAASIISAPPPAYTATETTLSDAYVGESLVFAGALAREGQRSSLVRFAVMCCRADAQPVAVRLARPLRERAGQWITARGRIVSADGALVLNVTSYDRTSAPADPFLYR